MSTFRSQDVHVLIFMLRMMPNVTAQRSRLSIISQASTQEQRGDIPQMCPCGQIACCRLSNGTAMWQAGHGSVMSGEEGRE